MTTTHTAPSPTRAEAWPQYDGRRTIRLDISAPGRDYLVRVTLDIAEARNLAAQLSTAIAEVTSAWNPDTLQETAP
jgi:hypothetical protein